MRNALTLMRMAHMKRMMDGHRMAWPKVDKRFERIFGGDGDGWGWAVLAPYLRCMGLSI